MLIDIMTRKPIIKMPFSREFDLLRSRLSEDEFDAIVTRINELIDDAGAEIATAGWLPGKDWSGTPFQVIYTKAAKKNYDMSAKLFGLLVWYTVTKRQETWASGKYKVDGRDIQSRTYFRVDLGGTA